MAGWAPPAGTTARWVLACVAGLVVGLPLATLWGVILMRDLLPAAYRVGLSAMALRALGGLVVGGCLGVAQAWALRRLYPGLSSWRWIGATAAAGYLSALAGMVIYGLLMLQFENTPVLAFMLAGPLISGLFGGALYGVAQGLVLDGIVAARGRWVWLVTLGWMLGSVVASLRWVLGLMGVALVPTVAGAVLEGLALGLVTAGAFRLMPPLTGPRSQP